MFSFISEIHLIKTSRGGILFHTPSYSLIEMSPLMYDIFVSLKQRGDIEDVLSDFLVPKQEVVEMIEHIQKLLERSVPTSTQHKISFFNKLKSKSIYRITLHVSNDCNLRCKYCYAAGGNYRMERTLMTMETAKKFVDFCLENFTSISVIVFFGGEPFLNLPVIEYICKEITQAYKSGKIDYCPSFGAVSNGTILNDQLVKIVGEYFSFITVSIDGPKEINDYNRIDLLGNGSYDRISNFIRTIKSKTKVRIGFEATYTEEHISKGYTHSLLSKFINEEFGISGVVTDEITLLHNYSGSQDLKIDEEVQKELEEICFPEGFWSVFYSIVLQEPKKFCQIVREIVSISVNGDIYPCHMDNGLKEHCLGNITGENIFNNGCFDYIQNLQLLEIIDNKKRLCGDCWAINICAGCTRKWFYKDGTYQLQPSKELCISNKKHLEKILRIIVDIRKNKQLWEQLCDKYKDYEIRE